jgi:hypothetical protein
MTVTIATGGCTYRMLRDERSMRSIIELAAACERSPGEFNYGGHYAKHTSNLWTGRAEWLRDMIADKLTDFAVSIDSDTAFNAMRLLIECRRINALDIAIGICPVRIGGTGECNLNIGDPPRRIRAAGLAELLKSDAREIESGGFGVAVFNLWWYREHWPLPAPEVIELGLGEDVEHCRAVRKRGGKVIALSVPTTHFAHDERHTQ